MEVLGDIKKYFWKHPKKRPLRSLIRGKCKNNAPASQCLCGQSSGTALLVKCFPFKHKDVCVFGS